MNLYKYYSAKSINRSTVDLLRDLSSQDRIKTLPSSVGLHYRKMDPANADYDPAYAANYHIDKPLWEILNCSNLLEGKLAYNGDFKVEKAKHCGHKYVCACCGTRDARRVSSQLRYLFLKNQDQNYKYFMLTLTLPNRFDGFRLEFDIYNKVMPLLSTYFGFLKNSDNLSCKGFFGAKELTYSKDKGFHPHLHLILAFDKDRISNVKYDRKGQVKSMTIKNGREKQISALSIRDKFVDLIRSKFPDYYNDIIVPYSGKLNIGFEPLSDIDNAVDEVCKYLIDYNSFKDVDSLFIYLRDIFRLKKYHKVGCFGWSEDLEDEWVEWCKNGKPGICNLHFIQFVEKKGLVYFGYRWGYLPSGKKVRVPFVYSRKQLYNDGLSVTLSYNNSSRRYEFVCLDPFHKLVSSFVSESKSDRLCNQPRKDVSDYIEKFGNYILF